MQPIHLRNQIRIIGGKWRGRKITVLNKACLRPTPDRVRETLFNWLAPRLSHARCLDLFAGSGVLGFEALSRGAAEVIGIERDRAVANQLRHNAQRFSCDAFTLIEADALTWLKRANTAFDIVFIDPPYQEYHWITHCVTLLKEHGCLMPDAYIYLESDRPILENALPSHWQIYRTKQAGRVYYALLSRFLDPASSHVIS